MDKATFVRGGRDLSRRSLLLGVGGVGLLGLTALSARPAWAADSDGPDPGGVAEGMGKAIAEQLAQAVTIKAYANSVLVQRPVSFSGLPNLGMKYEELINDGLSTAQGHARNYLNNVLPQIITNITNIGDFYTVFSNVPVSIPPGENKEIWLETLSVLASLARGYEDVADQTLEDLHGLHKNLDADTRAFEKIVADLNNVVGGDNGTLQSLNSQLASIQSAIDSTIADSVRESRQVTLGSIMMGIGSILGFGFPMVIGGVGVLIRGSVQERATADALASLNDQKAQVVSRQNRLRNEVTTAATLSQGYRGLVAQVMAAADAATEMRNAWGFLAGDLNHMGQNLKSGVENTDGLRTMFLDAANQEVKTVLTDIDIIKAQLASGKVVVGTQGQTIGNVLELMVAVE